MSPSYPASEGALLRLTKSLAIELAPHNIQVNAIAPAWIATDMTALARQNPYWAQFNAMILARTPAGRWGQPDETAGAQVDGSSVVQRGSTARLSAFFSPVPPTRMHQRGNRMLPAAQTLINDAVVARSAGRLADARQQLREAVKLLRAEQDAGLLARALRGLGRIERDMRNDVGALALYDEASVLSRSAGDAYGLGSALRHLGAIHLHAGRLEQAESPLEEAVALYRRTTDVEALEVANALRLLALLRGEQGTPLLAGDLWREARALYETVGVVEGVAESDAWLARLGFASMK